MGIPGLWVMNLADIAAKSEHLRCDDFNNPKGAVKQLDQRLQNMEFLIGNEFSVADILIGAYLLNVPLCFPDTDFSELRNVKEYMLRLTERRAYEDAYGTRVATQIGDRLSDWFS